MDKTFERDILERLTRREFQEWVHCFRVLLEKLAKVIRTKREANRLGQYITHELKRIMRINRRKDEENKKNS